MMKKLVHSKPSKKVDSELSETQRKFIKASLGKEMKECIKGGTIVILDLN